MRLTVVYLIMKKAFNFLNTFREHCDEYVWDHYETSVPMSTYLVAFVVSDFKYSEAEPTGNNVTFRIWSREDALDQVEYAKSIGSRILEYFEEFFNVEYPLPKIVWFYGNITIFWAIISI